MTTPNHELETTTYDPADLNLFHRNPRRGDVKAIAKSLQTNGQYRPIVVNLGTKTGRPNEVIAGNHTLQAAIQLGWSKITATTIDVNDQQAARIVVADNRTTDLATYDETALADLLQSITELEGTGYTDSDLDSLLGTLRENDEGQESWYTEKADVPQYEIVGERPALSELWDDTKTRELIDQINTTPNLPKDLADFLRNAAARHTVFNYRKAAEYYPHAPAPVQALMEASALVIVDVEDAIRAGFTRFHGTLAELQWESAQDGAVE